jgi:hypothetical protein
LLKGKAEHLFYIIQDAVRSDKGFNNIKYEIENLKLSRTAENRKQRTGVGISERHSMI